MAHSGTLTWGPSSGGFPNWVEFRTPGDWKVNGPSLESLTCLGQTSHSEAEAGNGDQHHSQLRVFIGGLPVGVIDYMH